MALAILYMMLFLPFVLAFAHGADQPRSSNITLGCSIRPATNPTAWFSPSGRFALGFYADGSTGFYVGVWLETSPGNKTVIWTANRDKPLVSDQDAMLKLTEEGLQLMQNNSEDIFITKLPSAASTASMLDSGNFIIYDANFSSLWESFGNPTDTIISGQSLYNGHELISSISETNYASGRFRLKMQSDGNLVMYPVETTDTAENSYWSSWTDGQPVTSLNLDSHGSLYLIKNDSKICNLTLHKDGCHKGTTRVSDFRKTNNKLNTSGVICRAMLNFEGILRLYSHDLQSNTSKLLFDIPETKDKCTIKGTCGFNSYCTSKDGKVVCICLPGFDYIDANRTWTGCKQSFITVGCPWESDNVSMSTLTNVPSVSDYYAAPLPTRTVEACSDACLKDCDCESVMFKDGECSKQKLPLKYARRDTSDTTVILIKVIKAESPAAVPEIITKKELSIKILAASMAATAGLVTVIAALGFFLYRRRVRRYGRMLMKRELDLVDEIALRPFSFEELRDATDNFKEVLGKGAFGSVFKGVLPNTERAVAIKRLEKVIDEGEREFRTEMRVIGRTHHKNLVRLLGFCAEGSHRLLVYEYMSNGSLADFIFNTETPHWSERVRITLDIAKGIHYLHEDCEARIIHCDIKPENILMDDNWTAKISDFGLAKLLMPNQTRTFTGVRGTRGYLAPEWHKNAPITVKADVYSFGIVLLEIVCCRKNMELEAEVDEIILLDWVYSCFEAGELEKLVPDEADMTELTTLVKVGLWCIQSEPASRPDMKNVMMMLEGNNRIPIPPPPTSGY